MEEWKIGDKCYIMTKEGKPRKCIITRPFVLVEMWVLSSGNGYWGPIKEEKMFHSKKECLQESYSIPDEPLGRRLDSKSRDN